MPIILLVDDSEVDRQLMAGLLAADVDWLVSHAKNGVEAMEMISIRLTRCRRNRPGDARNGRYGIGVAARGIVSRIAGRAGYRKGRCHPCRGEHCDRGQPAMFPSRS